MFEFLSKFLWGDDIMHLREYEPGTVDGVGGTGGQVGGVLGGIVVGLRWVGLGVLGGDTADGLGLLG